MTRPKDPKRAPERRRGLTNGNGPLRAAGRTNGLTNGRGATNGLTNGLRTGFTNGLTNGSGRGKGTGRVNGTGFTNGRGATNGLGRVNGLGSPRGATNGTGVINGLVNGTFRRGLRANRFGVITHKDLRLGLSLVVLFLLLLGPFYVLLSTPGPTPPTRIAPDGNLGDWTAASIAFLEDSVIGPQQDINFVRYSAYSENGYLSFAIAVGGIALGDNAGLDGFYIFIDSDNRTTTGYGAREIGADYMVSVTGGDNAVSSSVLYEYTSTADHTNWSAWDRVRTVPAGVSAASLEVQLPPNAVDLGDSPMFLLHASDFDGNETTSSVHFDLSLRALLVSQSPTSAVVAATDQPFASLTFTAYGGPVDVSSVSLQILRGPPGVTLTGPSAFAVAAGTPLTQIVAVRFASGDVRQYVVATLSPGGVSAPVPITVEGPDVVAYLGTAPGVHRVDGYFGDWTGGLSFDTGRVADRDVDIRQYAANHTGSTAFVYVDVVGRMFGGSVTPERVVRPVGGGGGTPSPPGLKPAKRGEDLFRAYIDVDNLRPDGTMVLGVRADFLVEIRGMHGKITSTRVYEWTGRWTPSTSHSAVVANDRTRFEAGLDLGTVATGEMEMAIEATDWADLVDVTDVYSFLGLPGGGGTRGAPILGPFHGGTAETAIAQPLTNGAATVDGNCVSGEYDGAGTFDDPGITGRVGTASTYVYICIEVTGDIDDDATDSGYIYFDNAHDGGTSPDADDHRFYVISGVPGLISHQGTGSGWGSCTDCDSANGGAGEFRTGPNRQVYEFKIRYLNVWGTDSPSSSQEAGFAVIAHDIGGSDYTWGSTSPPSDTDPSTWGHLDIPEFRDVLIPIAIVGVIYFIGRRRRRAADP